MIDQLINLALVAMLALAGALFWQDRRRSRRR
jgi:hypothetical protein